MSRCKILCADEMIVGRWYKLITYPVGTDVITNYWVKYSCESEKVCLLHDTVYIKETGDFTISCTDMYGYTDSKTITAIEEPTIERTVYEITPSSWSDLQEQVNAIGENAYISIPKGKYYFDLTDTNYDLPYGTVLDFNDSVIYITSSVTSYKGFRFIHSFNGIKNATVKGVNMGSDSDFLESCTFLNIYAGNYHKIENLTFENVAGFNMCLGTWNRWMYTKPNATSSQWKATNTVNGYLADDGTVVESTGAWCTGEMVECIETSDRSYGVGQSAMWIPTTVRLYDIAFYDTDGNFIEIRKDQEYFRKYYYPENAKYIRYCIHQENEPSEHTGADDCCIMRMMMGNATVSEYPCVKECMIDNIVHKNHMSGGFSMVGISQDTHINKMVAFGNGWANAWAFDIEDNWNSALACVVSHSYFGNGIIFLHGIQGVTILSTIMARTYLKNNVHFPTFINCIGEAMQTDGTRGNAVAINSYFSDFVDNEGYGNMYSFGEIDSDEANRMRTKINLAFSEIF